MGRRAGGRDARGRPLALLRDYPRETAIVFTLTAGGAIGFYTFAIYLQKLLVNSAGMPKAVVAEVMTGVLATMIFFPPLVGWIADRIGHRRTMRIAFGSSALCAVPALGALSRANDPWVVYLLCVGVLFLLSGYYALSAVLKAELYPTHIRGLGVSQEWYSAPQIRDAISHVHRDGEVGCGGIASQRRTARFQSIRSRCRPRHLTGRESPVPRWSIAISSRRFRNGAITAASGLNESGLLGA